jgi:DNA ligase-1
VRGPHGQAPRRRGRDVRAIEAVAELAEGASCRHPRSQLLDDGARAQVKKDYLAGVGDTFDLVVIGAYPGTGKRTGVYGAFLLASYEPETESYQAITKIGTGFSEEALDRFYQQFHPLEVAQPLSYVDCGGEKPTVHFKPEVVWEVACADLSLSPRYRAAIGKLRVRSLHLCLA